MAETVALSDGGYVIWSFEDTTTAGDPKGVLHVQKYAADGSPLGAPANLQTLAAKYGVWALAGGGYVVGTTQATDAGATLSAPVFGSDANYAGTVTAGTSWDLTASPDGGFLVASVDMHHHQFTPPDSVVTLYASNGTVISSATVSSQGGPQTSVDADGVLHANWTDAGGNAHTLAFDPQHPQTYAAPPAPGMLRFIDDVGHTQGVQTFGGTDDTTPTIRVPVTQTGWVAVEIAYTPQFSTEPPTNPTRFVEVTADDVTRGFKDIATTTPLSDNNYYVSARFESRDGVVGGHTVMPIRVDTQTPGAPTITAASDNVGASQGDVASGGTTDDVTPTLQISLAGTGAQDRDNLAVYDNGKQVTLIPLDAATVAKGVVSFQAQAGAGQHSYTAQIGDFANNIGPASTAFALTVDDGGRTITSSQYGDTLTGGAGNDTLVAGQGPDQLTGGAGADVFSFRQLPWNAGHTTDFAVGSDKLDLSALFQASGYTGSDPIRDGYVSLVNDGVGGAILKYDTDGPAGGNTIQYTLTTLDHISWTATWAQLTGSGGGQSTVNISPATVSHAEGNSGVTAFTFTITRTGDVSQGATTQYKVVGSGDHPADPFDISGYAGGGYGVGWVAGETSKTITVNVNGDTKAEADETFSVVLTTPGAGNSNPTAVGPNGTATGVIVDDDSAPPPADSGRVITSSQYGDTLTGGAGNDTLNAGRGPDQLTGGGGGDVFAFHDLPWNAGRVTDFTVGSDRIDLSALFSASGYTGTDPIADGYVSLQSDGAGGAVLLYDTDGRASGNTIQFRITDLEHVSSSATWAQLSGGGAAAATQQVNISPAGVSHAEGDSGVTAFAFTITRSGDVSQGATTSYRVVGSGDHPADASDFQNGAMPSVTFAWNPGESSRTITVNVAGDSTTETDETFSVVLQTPGAGNSNPTPVGPNGTAVGTILNDDAGGGSAGRTITSSQYGDTLTGGADNDTLVAGQGPDQLTGGGGADLFVFGKEPWNAGHVTDFTPGVDKLDFRGIFAHATYQGDDPVGAHVLEFRADGHGNTQVYIDHDDPNGGDWPFLITTLDGVSPTQIGSGDFIFH